MMDRFFPKRPDGAIALSATIILWAGAFPAITVALRSFDPAPLAAIRFALAAAGFAVLLLWMRPRRIGWGDLALAVIGGAVGIAAYNILLNKGQVSVSASLAGFIIGVQPLFAAVLAALFLKEHVTSRQWTGLTVSIAGLGLIMVAKGGGTGASAGVFFLILASVCSGSSFVMQRPLIKRLGLFISTPLFIISGAVFLTPWLGAGLQQFSAASAASRIALFYLAFGAGFLAYLTWAYVLKTYGAARASSFLFLMAPASAAIDMVFLKSVPRFWALIGAGVVFFGVVLGASAVRVKSKPINDEIRERRASRAVNIQRRRW